MVALNIQTVAIALMVVLTGLTSTICSGSGQLLVHQEIQQAARNGAEELNLSNRGLTTLPPEIEQIPGLKIIRR